MPSKRDANPFARRASRVAQDRNWAALPTFGPLGRTRIRFPPRPVRRPAQAGALNLAGKSIVRDRARTSRSNEFQLDESRQVGHMTADRRRWPSRDQAVARKVPARMAPRTSFSMSSPTQSTRPRGKPRCEQAA